MKQLVWLALGYNVPINPSKNRVYVWRKLKECGAGYFKQGVAILPKTTQSMEEFKRLSNKIQQMGGETSMVEMRFLDPRDEAQTIARFRAQSENEYLELIRDCAKIIGEMRSSLFTPPERAEDLRRMVKRYGKVKSRDYFGSRSQAHVADSLLELAEDMGRVTEEIGRQLKNILEL